MTEGPITSTEEIELIYYLRVIWKWKYLILAGTVLCAMVAAAISISMPKIFLVEMTIEPYTLDLDNYGGKIYAVSADDIKTMIEVGTFDYEIIQQLRNSDINNQAVPSKFSIRIPRNTNLLIISYETTRVDATINVFNQLTRLLSNKHTDKMDFFIVKYETDIRKKKRELSRLKDLLHFTEIKKENLKRRIAELEKEIQSVDSNIIMSEKYKDEMINDRSDKTILGEILYHDINQQNRNLSNRINNQILEYSSEIERAQSDLKRTTMDIDILLKELEELKQKKDKIKMIQVIQPPTGSPQQIRPKTKLNIVFASAVGFLFSLFLAFLLDYYSKHRRDLD